MSAQHSSESNEHYTPLPLISLVRELFYGNIDLDPFSCPDANKGLKANRIFTQEDNALKQDWIATTVFCNPPGGRSEKNRSMQAECWRKMYSEYMQSNFIEGIFLGFSLEILSKCGDEMLSYPICIPQPNRASYVTGGGRIKFDAPGYLTTGEFLRIPSTSPPHGNVIVYLPPILVMNNRYRQETRFMQLFESAGKTVHPRD